MSEAVSPQEPVNGPAPGVLPPLACTAALASLSLLPAAAGNPTLRWTLLSAAAALGVWLAGLTMLRRGVTVLVAFRPQHYVQACAQGSILLYWGWYWREVYDSAHLLLAQLLFAYAFEALLSWTRRGSYTLGFAPVPVIFSINLFLWFKPDWFYFQFLLIALGFAAKDLIRWEKDGRRVHVFNPSSFPLGLFSLGLILTGATSLTWGQEIATTLNRAPQMYLFIFLVSLPGQILFGVAGMTMAAVVTMYVFGLVYFALAGTYYFIDAYIPIAVFLGMHLLFTDPSTAPRSELGRFAFGALYALGVIALYGALGAYGHPRFYDKLLAVPVMNLLIQLIDRTSRTEMMRRVDPAALWRGLAGRSRNAAYVGVWTVFFILMSAAGGVGDTHRGAEVTFWRQACADNLPNGCRHYAVLVTSFCNQGSGWACNEYGVLLQPEIRPEQAARSFRRGCDNGFEAACANLDDIGPEGPVRTAPTLADYEIVLREGRRPLPILPPLQIYQRACEQGFADGCRRACEHGDRRACEAIEAAQPDGEAP